MSNLWQFAFFRYTIGISLILSALFALVSLIIVARKLSFLAIGTEHAAFGGAGIARLLGWDPFFTTMIFCSCITVLAGRSHKKHADIGTNLLFSAAMALGMILLSLYGRQSFNLVGFLFGDLIGITFFDLIFSLITTITVFIILLPVLGKIIYLSFDHDSAVVSGVDAGFWDTVVYASLSICIVLGIQLVGVLLVAALSVLPAAFALLWKKNIIKTLIIAFLFTLFSMFSGVCLSIFFDLAPGALIVAVALFLYFSAKSLDLLRA